MMKIKFKIYVWTMIDNQWPKSIGFNLVPNINFQLWRYETDGGWFTIMFSWLIFGITFDWRREWKKDD